MTRLAFVLPEWTRVAWVSARAREVWEPRVRRVSAAWTAIEKASVGNTRPSGLFFVAPDEIPAWRVWCDERKLGLLPVGIESDTPGSSYTASSRGYVAGQSWRMRTIVCETALLGAWQDAYQSSDETAIGTLLGYPGCCTEMYRRWWVAEQSVDTTFRMAANSIAALRAERRSEVTIADGERHPDKCVHRPRVVEERLIVPAETPLECNTLLRWMWLRLVPHLPCAFTCQETAQLGIRMAALGRSLGYEQEIDWLYEMLSWPVEWSALHGIAEIKTPAFKISTRTDATAHKWVVEKQGSRYPEEGATGVVFPYRVLKHLRVTGSRSYLAGIAHEPAPAVADCVDNGFSTAAGENAAHEVVLRAVAESGAKPGPVLDLGCGNGKLVAAAGADAYGVEVDTARAARATQRLGPGRVIQGDIAGSWPGAAPYRLILLMPGRVLELDESTRAAFRDRLARSTMRLVLYAYGDWLTQHGGLAALVRVAGLTDWHLGKVHRGDDVEAAAARRWVQTDHRCSGACCERFALNDGASPEDLQRLLAVAERHIAAGTPQGYDEDAPVLVPKLQVVQEPTDSDPRWYYRCGYHDRGTNRCTIYERRPRLCREYPSYNGGGTCAWCGFTPDISPRPADALDEGELLSKAQST